MNFMDNLNYSKPFPITPQDNIVYQEQSNADTALFAANLVDSKFSSRYVTKKFFRLLLQSD